MASVVKLSEDNITKKRLKQEEILMLYGSGDQPPDSDYKFFNTFGRDFAGKFGRERLDLLDQTPDSPIDMKFMDTLDPILRQKLQPKCPHSRFLLNNSLILDITVKLMVQYIKTTVTGVALDRLKMEKQHLMDGLRFIIKDILMVHHFDRLEQESDKIQMLSSELVDVMLDSSEYYN